jgi:hypothetical protein
VSGGIRWLNFNDLKWDEHLSESASEYIAWLMERRAPSTIANQYNSLLTYSRFCRARDDDPMSLTALSAFRADKAPDGLSEYVLNVRAWYLWSIRQYRWPCFSEDVQLVIEKWEVTPDQPRHAIRRGDKNVGPLHPTEDAALKTALSNTALDQAIITGLTGRQLRTFAATLRTLGIRPQQATWLKRSDLRVWQSKGRQIAILFVPRAKTGKPPRAEFKKVRLTQNLARLLQEVIHEIPEAAGTDPWLFSRQEPSEEHMSLGWTEEAWRPKTIDQALKRWAKRINLTSPLDGLPIHLTPKRLRYTYATNMAPKVSPAELAEALDHVDIRSIQHYYTYAADFFDRLSTIDGATKWGAIARTFLGIVQPVAIESDADGGPVLSPFEFIDHLGDVVGLGRCGSQTLCRLYPPLSCYLCPRFRPDPDADHLGILSALLSWREKRPTSVARTRDALQGQLDDVIEAVGHLVAVLRAFAALKALRESGAPRPSLSEIASEAQVPLDLVATDPSLTAYLEHWPSTTRAQARIQKRKERRG